MKESIEDDIENDFCLAYEGILKLPLTARFGVYLAYKYYLSLFKKIKAVKPQRIMEERIRIPNYQKAWVAAKVVIRTQLNML
jgi:phytoene/squalene synthetase